MQSTRISKSVLVHSSKASDILSKARLMERIFSCTLREGHVIVEVTTSGTSSVAAFVRGKSCHAATREMKDCEMECKA